MLSIKMWISCERSCGLAKLAKWRRLLRAICYGNETVLPLFAYH